MAKATYDFPADSTFKQAAQLVLEAGFERMMDNAPGTKDGLKSRETTKEGIDALHDMRVGSRRLRAALSVFGKLFSKEDFRQFDKEIGQITDALGAVRDLDVQIDTLRKLQDGLPPNEAYGIGRLIERQTKKRDHERILLLRALDKLEKDKFERKFAKALGRAVSEAAGTKGAK